MLQLEDCLDVSAAEPIFFMCALFRGTSESCLFHHWHIETCLQLHLELRKHECAQFWRAHLPSSVVCETKVSVT